MKKFILYTGMIILLCACNGGKEIVYSIEELNEKDVSDSLGVSFWDEFPDIEAQYGLTAEESMMLGYWQGMGRSEEDYYNSYSFFPNKFFLLYFNYKTYKVLNMEHIYFDKALGTWEIQNNRVRIKIYTIVT